MARHREDRPRVVRWLLAVAEPVGIALAFAVAGLLVGFALYWVLLLAGPYAAAGCMYCQ